VLLGDAEKAKQKIGWEPEYAIDELVEDMVEGDFKKLKGIPKKPEVSE
jgi:GDPmannose 4,6-dehydratase